MNLPLILALLVAIVGLVLYIVAGPPKPAQAGLVAFGAGLLAFLMRFGGHLVIALLVLVGLPALADAASAVAVAVPEPGTPTWWVPLLGTVFTALCAAATWALGKLSSKLGAQAGATKWIDVAAWFAHLAQVVVADLQTGLSDEVKARLAKGYITKEDWAALETLALARLKALAGADGLAELEKLVGIAAPQIDGYLSGLLKGALVAPSAPTAVAVARAPLAVAVPQ